MAALPNPVLHLKPKQVPRKSSKRQTSPLIKVAASAGIILLLAAFLVTRWEFREAAIVKALSDAGSGSVRIKSYHLTYLPMGGVAEGVEFRLAPEAPIFVSIEKLTLRSNPISLLFHHVRLVRAEGMHVSLPPVGSKTKFKGLNPGSTRVDEIEIRQGVVEIARKQEKPPLLFKIHELKLGGVAALRSTHFSASLSNAEPPGEIATSGEIGPWKGPDTQLSGKYTFQNADLGVFSGVSGLLSSQGEFRGVLDHINVKGDTAIPAFVVRNTDHPIPLNSRFDAWVNGVNGDTFLNEVTSRFGQTTVISKGSIARHPGQRGKVALLEFSARSGRIEDLLGLFAQNGHAPMKGVINFSGNVVYPPGEVRFLKKIEMQGDFGVSDSKFTHPATQQKVDSLSQRAEGKEPQGANAGKRNKDKNNDESENIQPDAAVPVLSNVEGHVVLQSGIANLSHLSFYIPGAHTRMQGTYNLITENVDIRGMLKMDAELAQTSHGPKSFFLKLAQPLFNRKKHRGSEIPVKITGDYHHPSFGIDLAATGAHALKQAK